MAWLDDERKKVIGSVLGVGSFAYLITPPVVGLIEEYLSKPMGWIKRLVSRKLVDPNLEFFEQASSGLRQAHEEYDEKKRAQMIRIGQAVEPLGTKKVILPRDKRAYDIADTLVTEATGYAVDFAATYAGLRLSNKVLKDKVNPFGNAMKDAAIALCVTTVMIIPGISKMSENIHFKISKILHKTLGVKKEVADDIGIAATYVTIPSFLGTVYTALWPSRFNAK
jgi:hypothetical protein